MTNTQVENGVLEVIAMALVLIGVVYLLGKYVVKPAFQNERPLFDFKNSNESEAESKGKEGEAIVAETLKSLPASDYTTLHDILIKVGDSYT